MSLQESTKCCSICETFVSGLVAIFEAKEYGGYGSIKWSFRDDAPRLPRLSESAKSCHWCEMLNNAITIPRTGTSKGKESIEVTFGCTKSRRTPGVLGDILSLETGNLDSDKPVIGGYKTDMKVHVPQHTDFDPMSADNIRDVRRAMEVCTEKHDVCPCFEKMKSPTRLVQILSEKAIKIIEPNEERRLKYAALSYCWGDSVVCKPNKTTEANIQSRLKKFRPSELTQTLQDAIELVRKLGIDYIWIDALCIIQGCTKDWAKESKRMLQYYGNAYVTIVPVLSESSDTGMMTDSSSPLFRKLPGPWSQQKPPRELILAEEGSGYQESRIVFNSQWSKRGWTYQERLVSSRIIYVFTHNLTLECREESWDSLDGRVNPQFGNNKHIFLQTGNTPRSTETSELTYDDWCWIVNYFTRRRLTVFKDDPLRNTCRVAFTGIMDTLKEYDHGKIVTGLLRDRLREELVSWRLKSPMEPRSHDIPSWTWLYTDWYQRDEDLIALNITSVQQMTDAYTTVEPIIESQDQSTEEQDLTDCKKLKIFGPILEHDALIRVLDCYRKTRRSPLKSAPGRGSNYAFLDDICNPKYSCKCDGKHTDREGIDCKVFNVVSGISPPISALYVGKAGFERYKGATTIEINLHFLLIQPKDKGPDRVEFRRVGTMHIPENDFLKSHGDLLTILHTGRKRTFVLV